MTMTKPSNRWLGLLGAAFIMASVAAFSSDFSDITDCIPGKAVGDEQEVIGSEALGFWAKKDDQRCCVQIEVRHPS